MSNDDLHLWETIRLPATCQTQTDIDDDTGELLVNVYGTEPPPAPPSVLVNGVVVTGVVRYNASMNRCLLKDVTVIPLEE